MFKLGVILLGAGAASRMGHPKLLLPWGNRSVLAHLLENWRLAGAVQVAVVTGEHRELMDAELSRLEVPVSDRIHNSNPGGGMYGSIQCAARWKGWRADLTHWAISLGDQPQVGIRTWELLIEDARRHRDSICQPERMGRPKHPVLLPADLFFALGTEDAENLKAFLEGHAARRRSWPSDDPGLDFDMDRPEDYDRALRHAGLTDGPRPTGNAP